MKALLVDDESKAREVLELLLHFHVPEFKEIKQANGANEATQLLKTFQPDTVFLDIKMPGKNGFEWLQSLETRNFDVIFTTAYDQYAIMAIRYAAFDYLLKPIDVEDLRNAMDRYFSTISNNSESFDNLFFNTAQSQSQNFRLTIRTTEGTHYLNPKDITRCEAEGNYTHFFLSNGNRILASRPLGHFDSMLSKSQFVRCHKSHLVNKDFVSKLQPSKITMIGNIEIDVSRRRQAAVKSALQM